MKCHKITDPSNDSTPALKGHCDAAVVAQRAAAEAAADSATAGSRSLLAVATTSNTVY